MMRKISPTATALALVLAGPCSAWRPTGPPHSPPPPVKPAPPAAATPSATFTELLSGKLYPNTIKRDELAPFYHFVTIIDAQGNPAQCATKGETQTLGGETFLVAYRLPDASPTPAGGPAVPLPDARLILIICTRSRPSAASGTRKRSRRLRRPHRRQALRREPPAPATGAPATVAP